MIQKITLLELNKNIQEKIHASFPDSIWVVAEISELKINRNGHCYIELVEKDAISDHIIAKSRATIWAFTFRMLKPYFENITGQQLVPGLKVLIKASVEFHELYGFSLNVTDIDPNYTLGDLAQKRAEILTRLEEEGVLNMNQELEFPLVPQKIAIISSETAAGYQDFINQLEHNNYGYKFYYKLFASIMQGLQAEESIIKSLEKIYEYENFFDIVVIIRGGGSQADLSCFNNYLLAANVAQYPVPVLTGIGHEKDESIVDIVAHKKLKTPTAVAEYIIEKTAEFEEKLTDLNNTISTITTDHLQHQETKINQYVVLIEHLVARKIERQANTLMIKAEKVKSKLAKFYISQEISLNALRNLTEQKTTRLLYSQQNKIALYKDKLTYKSSLLLENQKGMLQNMENKNTLLDPANVLKRGYSITYLNGKKLYDIKSVSENDELITKLFHGFIRSKVKEKMRKHREK
jgi:exodeoxyribonuclease VII large subunit